MFPLSPSSSLAVWRAAVLGRNRRPSLFPVDRFGPSVLGACWGPTSGRQSPNGTSRKIVKSALDRMERSLSALDGRLLNARAWNISLSGSVVRTPARSPWPAAPFYPILSRAVSNSWRSAGEGRVQPRAAGCRWRTGGMLVVLAGCGPRPEASIRNSQPQACMEDADDAE